MDRRSLELMAWDVGHKMGLPEGLLSALVHQESQWNPNARSPVGARGLTQIMPGTAKDPRVNLKLSELTDPQKSLEGGARYLKWLLERTGGNIDKALAAYNRGPYAKGPLPKETREYVPKVKSYLKKYTDPAYMAPRKLPGRVYQEDLQEDLNEQKSKDILSRIMNPKPMANVPPASFMKMEQSLNPTNTASVYNVKRGDTLLAIAKQLDVPLTELITKNKISNPNMIFPGQKLIY